MIRNFFDVTLRNLKRNALYSVINISGLSIGIVCSILILLWVSDETSFDLFIPKHEKLHQVWVNAEFDDKINSWRSVPLPLYEALKDRDSNIKRTTVVDWGGDHLLSVGDKRLLKEGHFVGDEFLEMFEFELLSGNAESVLDDPSSIVISESLSKQLFGNNDPIGELIRIDDAHSLKVTGVLKDIPGNSSFEFEYLMTYDQWEKASPWVVENKTNWGNYSFQVFVELYEAEKHAAAEAGIANLLTEKGQDDMPRTLFLHPMAKWRLYSDFENGVPRGGMSDYVRLFTFVAIFILLIACINFMNLATARSEKRAKEVGIRKSLGSQRRQIILQFIGESLVISIIAYILAIGAAYLVLPGYNILVDKTLAIDLTSPTFWLFSLGVIVVTGIISGSYPAFYLSSFNPVATLKGSIKVGKGATTPRKFLVVFQFGFSILLMITVVVIYQQIELVQNREIGYDQENLIAVYMTDDLTDNYDILKQELLQSGAVESVTRSNSTITQINSNNFLGWPGKPENQRVIFVTISAGYDYAKTMGIKMLHGRDFSKEFSTDSSAIVINKAALDLMGLEDPIGTQLDLWGDKRTLIGVMDNALMGSPYTEVRPLFVIYNPDWINAISVRLKPGNDLTATLDAVGEVFNKHNPAYPFDYEFADVEFDKKFATIEMTKKLSLVFSCLAIFITGLGLFGLASFTAEQRTKEIGIRKVLGASVTNLVVLMSKDFSRLVIVAFVLAAPIAWYLLDGYLDRYKIRIDIQWWIFPLVGLVALGFAMAIVSNQANKAAKANPVKSLRNE
ncbi:MAG: ABC transporter permease [Cyclobacteriaceae bacterium]